MPTSTTTSKTAKTSRSTSSRSSHDAIVLLTEDHKAVKKLFKEFEKIQDSDDVTAKRALVEQICNALTVHAEVEEEIFYPAARAAIKDDDLLDEATVEHASAKDLIAQLESMDPADAMYDAKVTVLGEYIDHHVQEEEGEMFPKVKKAKLDLAALSDEMQERKEALMGAIDSATGTRVPH